MEKIMSLRLIGASFGRTASLSLKKALEILGYSKCYHMSEVVTNPEHSKLWLRAWKGEFTWDDIFNGYQAAVDWPVAAFWPELMEAYPRGKNHSLYSESLKPGMRVLKILFSKVWMKECVQKT